MKLNSSFLAASMSGVLALALVLAVLTGKRVPFISGDRAAFTVLAIIIFVKLVLALARNTLQHQFAVSQPIARRASPHFS